MHNWLRVELIMHYFFVEMLIDISAMFLPTARDFQNLRGFLAWCIWR